MSEKMMLHALPSEVQKQIIDMLNQGLKVQLEYNSKENIVKILMVKTKKLSMIKGTLRNL